MGHRIGIRMCHDVMVHVVKPVAVHGVAGTDEVPACVWGGTCVCVGGGKGGGGGE